MAEVRPHEGGRSHAVSAIRDGWIVHKRLVLRAAALAVFVAAVVWPEYEFYRLLRQPTHIGPVQE